MRLVCINSSFAQKILKNILRYKTLFSTKNNLLHYNIIRFSCGKMSVTNIEQSPKTEESFKRLPLPKKGLCDKYEYSVIQLNNGLTALLICDVENLISLEPSTKRVPDSLSDSQSQSVEEDSEEESTDESASSADSQDMDVDESPGDKKSDENLAALSLTVGMGSFCDGTIPGLAHFLEHMVFMGSAKYPEENDFDAFLSSRGGSSNASTEYETTTFYFDVPEVHLKQSMDIFGNFFVEPLMRRDSIRGEMEIVDSEFQSSILNDTARLEQLLATTCSPDNPAGKFVWGNLDTLCHGVDEARLYASLHELRRKHYVANHMTLALQARLDLATLETWVVEHFSAIPGSESPRPRFQVNSPFVMERWHRYFTVKPVDDMNELRLTWITPPVQALYASKPLDVVSWFVGHEGPGSIVHELRDKRFLATEIEAGYGASGFDCNQMYALFQISITLTEEGVRQVKQIVDVVFQYLALLSTTQISDEQYAEIATIHRIGFDYHSTKSSVDYVAELSESMQLFPPAEFLTGGTLFTDYKPDLIRSYLELFRPCLMNLTLVSTLACADPGLTLDHTEQWFRTEYKVESIEPSWLADWERIEPGPCLHLPERNQFVTTDFVLLPVENEVKYPEKILHNDSVEVWFKQTAKYKLPSCVLYFVLELPHLNESLVSSVLSDVFLSALEVALQREVYDAYLAQYHMTVSRGEYGIHMTLNGFRQHMDKFLHIVLRHLRHVNISQELFAVCKDSLLRRYVNNLKDSEVLRRALRMGLLVKDALLVEDKHRVLRDEITHEALTSFQARLFERMYVKCLAMGNITEAATLSLITSVTDTLPFTPLDPQERREIRIACLEPKEKIVRVRSLNAHDPNCAVLNYYQSRDNRGHLRESCVLEILVEIVAEPLFDTLRTKQKLGYHVNATVRDTFGVLGLSVLVESQTSKHSVDDVEARIHAFISRYVRDNLETIRSKYEDYIATLVKKKKMVEVNLKEESARYFEEIKVQDYMFDRQEKELELIQKIQLSEVVEWIDRNIVGQHKKLSIQIVGTGDGHSDSGQQQSVSNEHKRKHSGSEDRNSSASNKLLTQTANDRQRVNPNSNSESHTEGPIVEILMETTSTNGEVRLARTTNTEQEPSNTNGTPSIESKTIAVSNGKSSDYLVIEYLVPNESDDRFIRDIKEYRRTLEFYPVIKLK